MRESSQSGMSMAEVLIAIGLTVILLYGILRGLSSAFQSFRGLSLAGAADSYSGAVKIAMTSSCPNLLAKGSNTVGGSAGTIVDIVPNSPPDLPRGYSASQIAWKLKNNGKNVSGPPTDHYAAELILSFTKSAGAGGPTVIQRRLPMEVMTATGGSAITDCTLASGNDVTDLCLANAGQWNPIWDPNDPDPTKAKPCELHTTCPAGQVYVGRNPDGSAACVTPCGPSQHVKVKADGTPADGTRTCEDDETLVTNLMQNDLCNFLGQDSTLPVNQQYQWDSSECVQP